jgi:RNA recognition motif-containing protein
MPSQALEAMHNYLIDGASLHVTRATSHVHPRNNARRSSGGHTHLEVASQYPASADSLGNVFVRNLPEIFTDDQLRAEFSSFGEIVQAKVTFAR